MECRKKVSHQLTPGKGATASGHNLTHEIRRPLDCEPVLDWPIFGPGYMAESVPTPDVVRFGTFEVDLRARELRKSGVRRKLGGQPFQVLAILLERPGDL